VSYESLFSPLRIGGVEVRNRIMQTAHVRLFSRDGVDSPRDRAYFVERAKGGIGLMVTGNRLVHPTSTSQGTARVYSWGAKREALDSDRRLTAAVKEHGAAIFVQLNHLGVQGSSESADDLRVLYGPSAVKSPVYGETAMAMSPEDIREVTAAWADSAEHSRKAGFDGVEVHIAHSYLLHQFFSPLYNKRDDEYGGPIENRLRFASEVVAAVRERVGADYVVGIRLSLTDFIDGGLTVDDAIRAVELLRAAAPLDYVNVSAAGYHNIHMAFAPSDIPDGWLVEHIAKLKATVPDLPVFAVGGIQDAEQADEIVRTGVADMVALTREQLADPEFANKVREGRESEVYHCIRINQGCFGRVMRGMPVGCTVNPATGREARFGAGTLTPAEEPRHWLVAGGGPAGMKAAETLAKRGHRVTLVERSDRLGGQVNLILRTPGRETFTRLIADLETQMRAHDVEIRLGVEATPALAAELGVDAALVATGALPSRTGFSMVAPLVDRLPGVDREHVVSAWDVLDGSATAGKRVVVLDDDGGRMVAGVAEVLLDAGADVQLVSRFSALFPGTQLTLDMPIVCARVLGKGLRYRLHSWARSIEEGEVRVYDLYTGSEESIGGVDTVVLGTGPLPNDDLYAQLREDGFGEVHRAGDCVAPRKLDHAIYEGYVAGRELFGDSRYIDDAELYVDAVVGSPLEDHFNRRLA
jgi:2,4-dienoyl-CoA reductase-like NADH-dependent reductase (Old Yellow Enzyme family)/pyruvate/2-oxoglutarate dehydrogenase complex dihydrolipoamide dehydrogenase (E3) component